MLVFKNKTFNQPLELDFGDAVVRLAPRETKEADLPDEYLKHRTVVNAVAQNLLLAYVKADTAKHTPQTFQDNPQEATEDDSKKPDKRGK